MKEVIERYSPKTLAHMHYARRINDSVERVPEGTYSTVPNKSSDTFRGSNGTGILEVTQKGYFPVIPDEPWAINIIVTGFKADPTVAYIQQFPGNGEQDIEFAGHLSELRVSQMHRVAHDLAKITRVLAGTVEKN